MNAKDQAKELVKAMEKEQGYDSLTEDYEQVDERSKQCAHIAVDLILQGNHLLRLPLKY